MKTALRCMLWLGAAMALFIVVIFVNAHFFEKPWLRYENLPLVVVTKQVHAGEYVTLIVERCNDSGEDKEYPISRAIRDEKTRETRTLKSIERVPIEAGCHRDTSASIHAVPLETPPGVYTFFGVATVRGSLDVEHKAVWYTEPFEVIP